MARLDRPKTGKHQHALAADAIGDWPGDQRAERQPQQRGAQHRPQILFDDAPVFGDRGGDIAHGGGIETVDGEDQESENDQGPVKQRKLAVVDGLLNVQLAGGMSHGTL